MARVGTVTAIAGVFFVVALASLQEFTRTATHDNEDYDVRWGQYAGRRDAQIVRLRATILATSTTVSSSMATAVWCARWSCTCQGFSDVFGTYPGRWKRATDTGVQQWWLDRNCRTHPTPQPLTASPTTSAPADRSRPCEQWKLAWFTQSMWEKSYVPGQLLAKVQNLTKVGRLDPHNDNISDCTIAVARNRGGGVHMTVNRALIENARKSGMRFAVVVLGDEQYDCDRAVEGGSEFAPVLIRNYWYPNCVTHSNIYVAPLGVKSGNMASNEQRRRRLSTREYSVVFASQHTLPTRLRLASVFSSIPAANVSARGEVNDYDTLMCTGKFALAPAGNVEDTWRLYEALNCGAIPIVTDGGTYFSNFIPADVVREFVTTDGTPSSVKNAVREVERLLANATELDARGERMYKAYELWQEKWQNDVARRIQEANA